MTVAIMVLGALGVVVGWRLVATDRVSIWFGQAPVLAALGVASLATGRLSLSARFSVAPTIGLGVGAGLALYAATAGFIAVARKWRVFQRHADDVYDQRRGLSLPLALLIAGAVVAPGEELFWRGLFQWRLAEVVAPPIAAALTWLSYITANNASAKLPIIAGAVVGGAVWGALSLWTHGVLASVLCHAAWTTLMLWRTPGAGRRARAGDVRTASA